MGFKETFILRLCGKKSPDSNLWATRPNRSEDLIFANIAVRISNLSVTKLLIFVHTSKCLSLFAVCLSVDTYVLYEGYTIIF
jgi:hypothetical protein